ncbi:Zn(2)-C6 fungal-specific transcription factor [Phycomyces blakesleeanus]|uniref:Zn(2)-C6 fungal-specific transcription factor n=2 Tax=Phycomyces blakesleeanus TaxID=4837 RepID=A0A167KU73_PHYB8|nr:Zn(2)-C6 fungal-specific transcription factor [Phycomyces blakesleeanus NRRL 1555(-)]OAD68897.1 Zn(2)-C6 fungal-specific transcription factor [Phycomyces blakesleeanus NRRL 1555(-)]|eukprot:XP_018286937.1 Zn(2)-C6 fungal-specific transcription factor [Phycomyces blakesleeanus NRRL 1555(-)]
MDRTRDMPPCARLKVGHACYTCRTKKIKCDGIKPCMQCKARGRICVFSKDGVIDAGCEESEEDKDHEMENEDSDSFLFSTTMSTEQEQKQQATKNCETITSHEMALRAKVLQTKDPNHPNYTCFSSQNASKSQNSGHLSHIDLFGDFIKWSTEPLPPSKYCGSTTMPPVDIQLRLLEIFFAECCELLPILPKQHFYQQLNSKGPLITPFLLNTLYMSSCRFAKCLGEGYTPELFYNRARRLLDDFMDIPRVSTVIGLVLLSIYEPEPSSNQSATNHCRAWMYSGMANRMCLELGLNSEKNVDADLPSQELEMRRRVFWGCFCLDKYQSSAWQRPWMICDTVAQVSMPRRLDEEDEDTAKFIQGLGVKIDLTRLCEAGIKLRASIGSMAGQISSLSSIESRLRDQRSKMTNWLDTLPRSMKWTVPLIVNNRMATTEDIDQLNFKGSIVSDLHLVYNINLLDCLLSMKEDTFIRYHRFITAAHLTHLARQLTSHPAKVMKFEMVGHAAIMAIKVYTCYLYDVTVDISRKAWLMYDQCIAVLFELQKYVTIPKCTQVLEHFLHFKPGFTQATQNIVPDTLFPDNNIVWNISQENIADFSRESLRQSSSCQTNSVRTSESNNENVRRPVSEPWGITSSNALQNTPIVLSQQSSQEHIPINSIGTEGETHALFTTNATTLRTPIYGTHSEMLNNQLPISVPNLSSPYSLTQVLDPIGSYTNYSPV